ncbi:MAG: class I SAM-dependent RNA methyltransferase [Ruminococcaceae bacterium]|nr:class I SAM-dependent RNA methyltransferase [Oscillospiraceae bacterium]
MTYQLVATCLFGLEKLLGEELDALGLKRTLTMDGRVFFEGEAKDVARANLFLRTAERVYVLLGSFPAPTFAALFDGTRALPWEEFVGKYDAFPVKGHAIKSRLTSIPDCQSIVKKAVVERLSAHYGAKWFAENSGVKYQIEFFIFKDMAYLMIDTSGVALHKRGYRPESGVAPIRETLAAAIALTARPREDTLFWDPFCGSGTLVIEAALIATGRAPGLTRSFAGEAFSFLPKNLWSTAREEAESKIVHDSKFETFASDIDEDMLDLVYENATRAGVEEHLNIFAADARTIQKPDRRGTLLCNPPYGERLMTKEETEALYAAIGKNFATFSPWQMYIITSCESFEKLFRRRADKTKRLYNGMIPCTLYEYFKPR